MRRALVPLIALVVLLAVAPAAGAKQWCVPPATGCTDGSAGTLQSALDLAKNNPGPDEIKLGVGTYTSSSGFTYDDNGSATNSVAIEGVNARATTLTRSSIGTILTITGVGATHTSVSRLRVHLTKGTSIGVSAGYANVVGVVVAGDASILNSTGLLLVSGAVRSVTVSMPVSGSNQGISSLSAGVFDSRVAGDTGVATTQGVLQRSNVTGGRAGVMTSSGTLDDVILHVGGSAVERVGLEAYNGPATSGSAVARHVTILGDGNPGSIGVRVRADAMFLPQTEALDLRSSIIRGAAHSYQRTGSTSPETGTANLTIHYTDYDPATRDESGPGSGANPSDPTNPNTDPLFVDSSHSDLRLAYNSPLIDKGDPAALAAFEPDTDFAGLPRVVNGRTDIGAYEYQLRPPVITSATATPSAAQVGTPFAFSAAATDPDADPVTFEWSFDDGATAPGASVQHAFANPGIHVATVKATDGAGLTATKTVAVGATVGPVAAVSTLKLAPVKFKAKKGTNVTFTLNVAAPVKFTVDRRAAGRKVKGKCVKPAKKNSKAKKCTRHLALKGSFSRTGTAGANKFHWNARLKGKALKPGSYRLIATTGSGLTAKVRRASFQVKR